MKIRNIILGIFCFLILLTLTGCGNKNAISTDDFKTITEGRDYIIADATMQYSSYGYINEATIAQSPEGWQIEFYVLSDESYAEGMFNTNKATFETYKGNSSISSSSNMENYSKYSLTSSGYYMYLCRIDNTLLYVKINDTYEDSVKDLINELGY